MFDKLKTKYITTKTERHKFMAALNTWSFDFILSTWFGTGLIIPAPGTWGTLGGMIFGIPLLFLCGNFIVFLTALALFFLGLYSVKRIEKKLDNHDPSFIVIDEVAAILLMISCTTFINTPFIYTELFIAFLSFRFFDARKPSLIGWVDRKIKGAMGVMIDDIVAAIFAMITYKICVSIFIIIIGIYNATH
jgi:phosphatidylglycerophosphatase A